MREYLPKGEMGEKIIEIVEMLKTTGNGDMTITLAKRTQKDWTTNIPTLIFICILKIRNRMRYKNKSSRILRIPSFSTPFKHSL